MTERSGLVQVKNSDDGGLSVSLFAELKPNEREYLLQCNDAISDALASLHIQMSAALNYQELTSHVEGDFLQKTARDQHQSIFGTFDTIFLDVSRMLLNLSASFNSYVDHQRTHFAQRYGKQSYENTAWLKKNDSIRARSAEFVLMWDLRNYAQHVDMPPLKISHSQNASDVTTSLRLARDPLLRKGFKWHSDVLRFLKQHTDDIDLLPFLHGWMTAFEELVAYTNSVRLGAVRAPAQAIRDLRERYSRDTDGFLAIWDDYPVEKPETLQMSLIWLNEAGASEILARLDSSTFDKCTENSCPNKDLKD